MLDEQHKNSRKVTIFRSGSFLSRAQGNDVQDFLSNSKKSIGSYYENTSSRKIGNGLTITEEEMIMPLLVDCLASDREFRKKVSDFFIEIDTQIPYKHGRELEIGLTLDNSAELFRDPDHPTKNNIPINLMDYVRYRHALKHPQVSLSKELADGNALIEFYIFDKAELNRQTTKNTDQKDTAMAIYLTMKPSEIKVDQMLTLMGVDPREFAALDIKQDRLRKLAETKPVDFIKISQTTDLELNYWVKTMVNTGVLKVLAGKYLIAETDKLIANSLEETIFYLGQKENSDMLVMLKAQNQEAMNKPLTTGRSKQALMS